MNQDVLKAIYVKFGDIIVKYHLHYSLSITFFGQFSVPESGYCLELEIEQKHILDYFHEHPELKHPSDAEVWLLLDLTALQLLQYGSSIFHAAAFIWKDKAWLFTAPSGTGKTTQYLNWHQEYGQSVQIINGDKPILFCHENKGIFVQGSPWRGKEKLGKNVCAPLGGVVFLEQGCKDKMEFLCHKDAVLRLFPSFWARPESENEIQSMSCLIERLICDYPVWKLTNKGDLNSVYLAEDHFKNYLE